MTSSTANSKPWRNAGGRARLLQIQGQFASNEDAISNSKLTTLTEKEAKEVLSYYSVTPDLYKMVI